MIELTTQRLKLRPFKAEDFNELFEIIQEDNIREFLPGVYTTSKEELLRTLNIYINADFKDDVYLAIINNKTNKLIGAIIMARTYKNNMEISYFICKEQRGNGFMFEALQELLNWYGRSKIENNILFLISRHNTSSQKLCIKMRDANIPIFNIAGNDNYLYYSIRPWCLNKYDSNCNNY